MQSLRELFRIGCGPSSSHTMGPQRAAADYRTRYPDVNAFRVTLYGSLAATGRGHLTDVALHNALSPHALEIIWKPDIVPDFHPNGIDFETVSASGQAANKWRVYSVGGGALREENVPLPPPVYRLATMTDILKWCDERGAPLWRWVEETEGPEIWDYLQTVWAAMQAAIQRGLKTEGTLPGGLKLRRKAHEIFQKALTAAASRATGLISAYALAVMEENGSAGVVVTAPTCGACGTVPAVLQHMLETVRCSEEEILKALAIAGIVGNLVKTNASISGAEVGCQGEVGTACAMASAAAAYLLGGTPHQCEYAAEMGMEHHLGLTCDPVLGLVQIPCIERNAFAATRAVSAGEYAMFGDGSHRISFDEVVQTMKVTGESLSREYRETSLGGLARVYQLAAHPM